MEIERKYLIEDIAQLGFDLAAFPHAQFVQAYICTDPTIRIRREDAQFFLTIKGKGEIAHEELQMEIDAAQFERLWAKIETAPVEKTRYFIPLAAGLTAELDVYAGNLSGLATVEVEFASLDDANAFVPPDWFGRDITADYRYRNSALASGGAIPDSTAPH